MKEIIAKGTIGEALGACAGDEEAVIRLEGRVYEEKVFAEKRQLTLEGSADGSSTIVWRDAGRTILSDGLKRGTFRSYTAFFSGERLTLRNLTIRNDAGDGRIAGQCIAAYLDSALVLAEGCTFVSAQDTLFLSPLPDEEREPRGFIGPRVDAPRKLTRQYFRKCLIVGDIDFIFGGADAVFEDCEIVCRDREHEPGFPPEGENMVNGYVTAPCGKRDGLGFVFLNCRIRGEAGTRPGSVFLGRPWRPEGKAAFLNCSFTEHISPKRFSGWRGADEAEPDACFAEYGSVTPAGEPISMSGRNPWVRMLDDGEAAALTEQAEALIRDIAQ